MRSRLALQLLFVALAGALVSSCARRLEVHRFPKAPVILISIDTLRSDHLPAYGYTRIETPFIDRFRSEAIFFEHAYTPCPMTLPAHTTMLTGELPRSTAFATTPDSFSMARLTRALRSC